MLNAEEDLKQPCWGGDGGGDGAAASGMQHLQQPDGDAAPDLLLGRSDHVESVSWAWGGMWAYRS